MYLIIGKHSLLLLLCQGFPCKPHLQIAFQSPPHLTEHSPQKYHFCWPLGREPGCAENSQQLERNLGPWVFLSEPEARPCA